MAFQTVTISRASTSDLVLSAANGYRVRVLGPGTRQWALNEVEGDYQHGSAVLGARLIRSSLPLHVTVTGSSLAQVNSRAAALVNALSERSYTVTVQLGESGSATSSWACHPADISPVAPGSQGGTGAWEEGLMRQPTPRQSYRITIPRQPVPIQGAL